MWLLLLALLPLDLHAGDPPPGTPDLSVRLEIAPGEGATHYRIVHTWRGAGPRRFVTGATDRNCEDPIDVLLADGKPIRLFSSLPCGGFAFRSTRELRPGDSWAIEGDVFLEKGARAISARYCPKEADLKSIDPAVRAVRDPPWWLGCVDSAAGAPPDRRGAGSPEEAWARLLEAMKTYDRAAIDLLTTSAGLHSLRAGLAGENESVAFARWGRGWSAWPIRWRKRSSTNAEASLGPEVKEHGLSFLHDRTGWRLGRRTPGE